MDRVIALIENALTGLEVEGKSVDFNYLENPKQANKRSETYITYIDISQVPTFSANDVEIERTFYIDVDIWTSKAYLIPTLQKSIETRLNEVGFSNITHASTTFSEGMCHKPLSFRIQLLKEEI